MSKILIVDDDEELRSVLSDVLRSSGYETDAVADGKEAIEMASSIDYDIVMLDFMLPGIKGPEVLEELKKISPRSKVIMITAFATIENAIDAIKRGASEYVSKPFKVSDIIVTVRRVLEEAKFENDIKGLDLDFTFSSLANPVRRSIIQLLHMKAGMRLMELTRELDIEDHTKVVFHLKVLKDAGLIWQDDKVYTLTSEGERMLDCLQFIKKHLSTS